MFTVSHLEIIVQNKFEKYWLLNHVEVDVQHTTAFGKFSLVNHKSPRLIAM
jgi:hypothetical protein